MRSAILLSCLMASVAFAQQRRVPFEFDAGVFWRMRGGGPSIS